MKRCRYTLFLFFAVLIISPSTGSAVDIDWVTVGDPGNECDPGGDGCYGSVTKTYRISKYEITNAQYAEFLNAKAASDPLRLYDSDRLYDESMGLGFGGITRHGSSGSYTYNAVAGREAMPVNFVKFYDMMRFANWLNNGQGSGDTETGAYTLIGGQWEPSNWDTVTRNVGAEVFLTSEDEWYKAAYYDPISRSYFNYPTGTGAVCAAPGATANTANCDNVVGNLTTVGSYTNSPGPNGTFDQGGNVWEWTEGRNDGSFIARTLWGGAFSYSVVALTGESHVHTVPSFPFDMVGFRVASPVPSAALTATVEVNGFSFALYPTGTSVGVSLFFTTYDGSAGAPLQDCGPAFCTVSSEFAPTSLGSSTYRGDYFAQDTLGTFEYGSVVLSLATSDGDGDGLPDALERQRNGSVSFSGTTFPDFNAFGIIGTSAISGSIVRSPGSRLATYSGSYSNLSVAANFAGTAAISGANGTLTYDLGGSTLTFNLSQTGIDGSLRTFVGTSTINRISNDTIEIPSFTIVDSGRSLLLFVNAFSLNRSGNVFRGVMHLADGEPLTSWADFTTYVVEITDTNDTNNDGLPDLVAVPEPTPNALGAATVLALSVLARRPRIVTSKQVATASVAAT